MTDKFTPIEETLAHQDQQIQDLSEMLIAQGEEIKTLKREVKKIQGKMGDMEEAAGAGGDKPVSMIEQIAMDKPPHY